jgi:ATP-binding cassette subfamily C (CFTR/MRP) protein 4
MFTVQSQIPNFPVQNFLLMEEHEIRPESKAIPTLMTLDSDGALEKNVSVVGVTARNVTAKWNPYSDEPTLDNVSFSVKPGQLLGVIGPVGAGKVIFQFPRQPKSVYGLRIFGKMFKGSLLQCILRELPLTSGTLTVTGKVAYTSQEPWIFGGSVRDNILFGSDYEPDKYERVLRSCALERDLSLLPYGDSTLVGDRGISLSGGQKARVNLAR